MGGELRANEVEFSTITDAAAALIAPGCVTTLVGVMAELYRVLAYPTSSSGGIFSL